MGNAARPDLSVDVHWHSLHRTHREVCPCTVLMPRTPWHTGGRTGKATTPAPDKVPMNTLQGSCHRLNWNGTFGAKLLEIIHEINP